MSSTNRARKIIISGVLLGAAIVQTVTRYLRIQFGEAEWDPNFANVWRPLSQELHTGASLYTNGMGDNKPPLFELLNFLVGGLPNQGFVFLFLVGIANGLTALLLYRFVSAKYPDWFGLVAASIWLLTLTQVNGTHINVRSFALVGILCALYVDSERAFIRGAAIAVAGLFSQYALLFLPVLAWDSVRELAIKKRIRWLTVFGTGGLLILVVAFSVVGLIWGSRAALAGLYWSYGLPTGVTTTGFATAPGGYLSEPWVLSNTLQWGGRILYIAGILSPLFLGAGIRGLRVVYTRQWNVYLYAAVALLFPLLIRSYYAYWLLSLPFIIHLSIEEIWTKFNQ
jgi:hypothetical protein